MVVVVVWWWCGVWCGVESVQCGAGEVQVQCVQVCERVQAGCSGRGPSSRRWCECAVQVCLCGVQVQEVVDERGDIERAR